MSITKKIIAIVTALTIFSMVSPVLAVTVEELQASINSLLTTLAGLQAQLAALTGGTAAPAACTGITFTSNLGEGSTGTDVKCLQALLNQNTDTQVATTGVGSPGAETTYFGSLTKAAVIKFQEKYAATILTPLGLTTGTGFVGSATRTKLNTLLTVTPPPIGCTTNADCTGGKICTAGVCVTAPIADQCTSTPGAEGSLIGAIYGTPSSGISLTTSQTAVAVGAVELAATDSNIKVDRLDLNFDGRPYLYISKLSVYAGDTLVKSQDVTEATTTELSVGTSYNVRISGLNILINKDTKKVITVKVDGKTLPAGTTTKAVILTFDASAFRGVDCAGIDLYAPSAKLSTRTFTVKNADTAVLELSTNADNPKDRPVLVSGTATTEGVVILKLDVKAKYNSAYIRTINVNLTSSTTTPDTVFSSIKLYDGDTAIESTSTAAISKFDNLSILVNKDTTKTLTIKGDVNPVQSAYYAEGNAASGTIALADVTAEDYSTFASVTATNTGSVPTGKTMYLYEKAPTLALVSTSITGLAVPSASSGPQEATAVIKLNITANGGDIYIRSKPASEPAASSGLVMDAYAGSVTTGASTTEAYTFTSNAEEKTYSWLVPNGQTKWFEITGTLSNADTLKDYGYYIKGVVENVKWDTADVSYDAYIQEWGLTDFRTSEIFLKPNL
jgi:hypothetical protein